MRSQLRRRSLTVRSTFSIGSLHVLNEKEYANKIQYTLNLSYPRIVREIWPSWSRFHFLNPQEVICIPAHLCLSPPLYRCVEFHLYRRKYLSFLPPCLPCSAPIYSQICLMMPTEGERDGQRCAQLGHLWAGHTLGWMGKIYEKVKSLSTLSYIFYY